MCAMIKSYHFLIKLLSSMQDIYIHGMHTHTHVQFKVPILCCYLKKKQFLNVVRFWRSTGNIFLGGKQGLNQG